jgi:hypothetical protein
VILARSNCNLTRHFRMIAQRYLTLFVSHYKWYHSKVSNTGALHNMNPNKDVRDLSGGDCDTLES